MRKCELAPWPRGDGGLPLAVRIQSVGPSKGGLRQTAEMTLLAAPSLGWVAHPVLHQATGSTTHVLSPAASDDVMYHSR